MKKPDAILTADWHLQDTQPRCRLDEFWTTQWKKVDFISTLQKKYDCPVLHAGDLFDTWKPSPMLLSKTIQHLPKQFYTVYGNHDLPQHNIELAYKSGIYVLEQAKKLTVLDSTHWRQPKPIEFLGKRILVWHVMTWTSEKPWFDCTDPSGRKLLKTNDADLILTGHNHKTFVVNYQNKILVNPGSIFRTNADQIEHKPCVFLWYKATNTFEQVFIPAAENVVSREHIEEKKERVGRIDSFIEAVKTDYKLTISFEKNLERFLHSNEIDNRVENLVLTYTNEI